MLLLADSNIVAGAVSLLRASGHDVVYAGERSRDPGDAALLSEALAAGRVLLTKDRDIGTLVHRNGHAHAGVLIIDDLGDPVAESELLLKLVTENRVALEAQGFLRASGGVIRERSPR